MSTPDVRTTLTAREVCDRTLAHFTDEFGLTAVEAPFCLHDEAVMEYAATLPGKLR
jgi:hypothetical protein